MTLLGRIRLPLEHNGLVIAYTHYSYSYALTYHGVFLQFIEDRTEAIAEFHRLSVEMDLDNQYTKIGGTI